MFSLQSNLFEVYLSCSNTLKFMGDIIIKHLLYQISLTKSKKTSILGLPKPPHVKTVFEGADGLLAGLDEGKVWIDHSTTDHEQNKVNLDLMI